MKLASTAAVVAVVLAACGGTQQPAPPPTQVEIPNAPYCPPVHEELGPWAHELFPDCPAMPIAMPYHVCAKGACAKPCGAVSMSESGGAKEQTDIAFLYDDQGRYIGWTGNGEANDSCTYVTERLARCKTFGVERSVERDPNGRILAVTTGDVRTPVTYNAQGWVVALGERTLRYDHHHRLIAIGDTVIHIDSQGRVTSERSTNATHLFEHDERGRIVHVEVKPQSIAPAAAPAPAPAPAPGTPADALIGDYTVVDLSNDHPMHMRFRYDGDRLAMASWDKVPDEGGTMRYVYDCK